MISLIVYTVVFLLTFFAASYMIARFSYCDNPTDSDTFLVLVAVALAWPLAIPVAAAIFLLLGIATLAETLAGGAR